MPTSEPVLTVAAMRAAEAAAGVSEWELMQRAGEGAAQWIWRVAAGRAITVLCGPGNNGGDGYVIAEWLRSRGLDVAVVAPAEPATETARRARGSYSGPVLHELGKRHVPVMVDALFGFGLSRRLTGEFAKLLEQSCTTHGYCIAIDLPSGVESDTGAWLGTPFHSDLTLALGAWKRAHWLMPASAAMGEKRLVDIGLDLGVAAEALSGRPRLHAPVPDSHKYTRGLVAIVGGSMPGAALLAAKAALRAGAGNVRLLTDHPHPAIPPELVVKEGALEEHLGDERIGAVLVGPGLGRDDTARERLAAAIETGKPCVIDADALHLLDWDALEGVAGPRLVLTPHTGELAALCKAFGVTAESKLDRAVGLRDAISATVLAKGQDNLLAPAGGGGTVYFPAGSSWLSAAGTGDVLAGIAASRLAHHDDPALAAEEAVWLHGEAARIAGPVFTAGELARAVRPAFTSFL